MQQVQYVKIGNIISNPNNPRILKDAKFEKLVQSLVDFPEMLEKRPLICVTTASGKFMVLGGNQRLKAATKAGIKQLPVMLADDWSEEKRQEFIIKDNLNYGDWNWETVKTDWDADKRIEWGLEEPEGEQPFGNSETEKSEAEEYAHVKLTEKFIVPPFSILDTRQGYWSERKSYWKTLIKDNGESRENTIAEIKEYSMDAGYSRVYDKNRIKPNSATKGVSILDPVLCELVNLWFGLPNSKTFDCFAGDTVFGYVSSYMGNSFTGIELRQEQSDLNNERIRGFNSKYICDDGQNVLKHIGENSQDLLFSCPPYFDLEVYSDLPNDASNQKEYNDFIKILDNAFTNAIKCLKNNRFAVIVVGDIRDKRGFYYRFTDDIKDIFKRSDVYLYNELILIESIGTLPQRVGRFMEHRKIGKCHQNVLVFFKGNPKEIKNIYPTLEIQVDESANV